MKEVISKETSAKKVKNIRFPNDIVKEVEETIIEKNCTYTAFVVEAVKKAICD